MQKEVIELPVNDSMLMQEMQCQNHFRAVETRPILVEFSRPLNLEHEIAAVDIFHHEEKSVLQINKISNLEELKIKDNFTLVWKHECKEVKNGWLADNAKMRFSVMVHSTSSSWMMTSFLRTLMAKTSSVSLFSANITLPKEPLPKTLRNRKSSNEHLILPLCLSTISLSVVI